MDVVFAVFVGLSAANVSHVRDILRDGAVALVTPDLQTAANLLALRADPASLSSSSLVVSAGSLRIDLSGHVASCRGSAIRLTEREIQILAVLANQPGTVFTCAQLLEQVWGMTFTGDATAVQSAIKRLRSKIRDAAADVGIETVRGVGFKLVAPARAG